MIDVARDDIVVMLEAGYVYLAMRKFKEAKEVFEGLTLLAKKHEVPLVGLANVYFAQGKFMESVRTLKQAVKANGESAFAWAYLGESQLFYGKYDDARECLNKASELEPEGKSGEFARSLLNLMEQGYDPVKLRKDFKAKVKEIEKEQKEKAKS